MKKIFLLAALALTMAACSNEDNITEQPADILSSEAGIPFSATISTGGATRALSGPDTDGKIQATWAENEEVALVYEVGGTTIVTKATVSAVSDGTDGKTAGTATINAILEAGVANGDDITLIYPYSMVETSDENIGKLKADAFIGQNGTLTGDGSISAKYDLRQGTGKITLATTPATLKDNVTMASQICIWKLTTKSGGSALNVTKFDVYFGGATASASISGSGSNEFYMAVPAGKTGLAFLATAADGTYIYSKDGVTLDPSTYYESEVSLTKQNTRTISDTDGEVTLNDGDIVSGTGGANTKLFIASGATVTLNGVTNNSFSGSNYNTNDRYAAGIECLGDATIILADGSTNEFRAHWERAAVYVHSDCTLTIRGGGKLIADNTGNEAGGAGIGGSFQNNCGNIVIEGGTITAKGSNSAGIGSGNGKSCGTIAILGGTITATGDGFAAGIGGGGGSSCGSITISGSADVTATGGAYAAGIGSGQSNDSSVSCGNITIGGSASVEALGGQNAAGIGSGHAKNSMNGCGNITISGSASVKATGGRYAAGIGAGNGNRTTNKETQENINILSSCGDITISGGTVTATGGENGAGIGSGSRGKFKSINITSGITSVTATRSNNYYNVPIGKGYSDQGSGAVTFGGVTMHNGTGDVSQSNWTYWPTDGQTYGGIKVSVTGSDMTWTLTPAP